MANDTSIMDLLSVLAPVLGGASAANQKQNNFEDVTKNAAWNNYEDNKLARDKFAVAAPGERLATANRASMSNNVTPTSVSWGGKGSGKTGAMPVWSGGASHAARDPRATAVGNSVLDEELMSQLKGAGGADTALSPQPAVGQESLGAKLLGGAATGTAALSALDKLLKGAGGSGGGGDLSKLLNIIRGHRNSAVNPGDDPNSGYGMDPNLRPDGDPEDPMAPTGNVTTNASGVAGGPGGDDAGGYYDESGQYVPDTWTGAGAGQDDPFGLEPGSDWGG